MVVCACAHDHLFVLHVCVHDLSVCLWVYLCVSVCVRTYNAPPPRSPPPESQEVSVEIDAAQGGVAIPEISVTGVGGERMANGDSLRPRPESDMMGSASEVSPDPRVHDSGRGQEVRRQKSVRRMVENEGSASTGRSQY